MTGLSDALNHLRTLGSVDLRTQDGTQLASVLRQPKRLGLLVYLALNGPAFQRRDRVLALFWPESDDKSARGSLSQAVFQLRAVLGRNAIIGRGDDELAVNAEAVSCDVVDFQAAIRDGRLEAAMELYQGELLPSFTVDEAPGFEDWLAQRRTELAAQAATACRQLAEQDEKKGDFESAVQWLRRAITIQPFNELLHQQLIRVLDRKGNRAAALQAFEELRGMLRNEFDAEPAAETLELIEAVRTRAPNGRRTAEPIGGGAGESVVAVAGSRSRFFLVTAMIVVVVGLTLAAVALWRPKADPNALPPERVAVLFFNDESPNRDLGYLAESLTSTLIDQLTQVRQLEVISQNGVRQFRGTSTPPDSIARQLDAGTIVGGSVTRSQDRLRVTVEMIQGDNGVVLRSRTLERPTGELFALLDELSAEVSSFLRTTVGQQVRTVAWRAETRNVDAWRTLQKAEYTRSLAEQADRSGRPPGEVAPLLARADSFAQQALNLDKNFVSAVILRGVIADRRAWLALVEQPRNSHKWLVPARQYAESAVRLDDKNAAAYELRGVVENSQSQLDAEPRAADSLLKAAETDLRRAIALGGERSRAESVLSSVLYVQGRYAESRMAAQRALEADAYLADADQIVNRLFQTSFELGDDAEAGHWCDEVRRRFVGHWPTAHCDLLLLAWSREGNHDPRKAMHLLENFAPSDPEPLRAAMHPRMAMLTAAAVARAGMRDSAQAMLERARAEAPGDIELLPLEAAARLQMNDDARALDLVREYLRLNPAARARILNSRIFAHLRTRIN